MKRALSCVVAIAALGACSAANQTPTGGEFRFDAAVPPPPASRGGGGGPATWTALYGDLFGKPNPGPGCAGTPGQCHGAAGDPGAQASKFVCGTTKDACFAGITNPDAKLLNQSDPKSSLLLNTIRWSGNPSGVMPKQPATYVFADLDIQRLEAWMMAGAPNN